MADEVLSTRVKLENVTAFYVKNSDGHTYYDKTASMDSPDAKIKFRGVFGYEKSDKKNHLAVKRGIRNAVKNGLNRDVKFENLIGLREELNIDDGKRIAVVDGDKKRKNNGDEIVGYAGKFIVSATSDDKIKHVDRRGNNVEKEDADEFFYSGAKVNAWVEFYCIKPGDKKRGGAGVFAQLKGVQYVSKGERIGGSELGDDEIDDLGDEDAEDDDGLDEDTADTSRKRVAADEDY